MKIYKKSLKGSIKRALTHKVNTIRAICEVLRLIYDKTYEIKDVKLKEEIRELLIEVFEMAKKMGDRLKYYKKTYNDTTGHGAKNLKPMTGVAKRLEMRLKRDEAV